MLVPGSLVQVYIDTRKEYSINVQTSVQVTTDPSIVRVLFVFVFVQISGVQYT